MDRRVVAAGMAASLVAAVGVSPAVAQDGSPAAGGAPSAGPWTAIAAGLNAPRGLAWGPDGTLYVAEQGTGGDQCQDLPEGGQGCFGLTATVSALKDGQLIPVVTGLPSLSSPTEVGGISDIAVTADGGVVVLVGLGGGPEARENLPPAVGPMAGTLSSAAPDGTLTVIADLAQWEADNNPDKDEPGSSVDSNPYGLANASDGGYLVADAGGNDLLMVARDGTISFVAGFPVSFQVAPVDPTMSPAPDPAASPQMVPMQAVPTAVTIGPDGAIYVSQLTGFPFPVGGASIFRVEAGKDPTVYATGLTNVMDLAFAPDGTLYVVEFAQGGLLSGDITGALLSVPPGGGAATLVTSEGLMAPGGVAVGPDGTVYVANGSVMPGGGALLSWAP